ncbi:hypothetical protein BSKO_03086 [Bryopsis sp. KO-2023]|nr:hypothetical protein BSKO_03086 [Bryopsis sp. KO-2023]
MNQFAVTGQSVTSKITLRHQPMDLDFHPGSEVLAVGMVNGALQMYRYSNAVSDEEEEDVGGQALGASIYYKADQVASKRAHKASCRALCFSGDGTSLFSGSADGGLRVTDGATGKKIVGISKACENGISRLLAIKENLVVSGEDDGCIKLWDARQRHCCGEIPDLDDFVSDMAYKASVHSLVASSGDLTITINDLRKFKCIESSNPENCCDEPLCVEVMDGGMKIVAGLQSGRVTVYPWGNINFANEVLKGHPDSVDAIAKYDEETIITGCGDGVIRAAKIAPKGIVATIGQHGEDDSISRVAIGHDFSVLGSIGNDDAVRLWDLTFLEKSAKEKEAQQEDSDENDEDSDSDGGKGKKKRRRRLTSKERKRKRKAEKIAVPSFFSDL